MSLTSNLAYTVKPSAVSARAYTHSCNTINGTSFSGGDVIKLDIPCGIFGEYLDANNSFIKLKFTNNSGQTFTLDSSILSVINRMTVEYSGYTLEDVSDLGVLSSIFMDTQIDFQTKKTTLAIQQGTSGSENRSGASFANSANGTFTFGLPSFILGLTASKYIPLGAMTSSDTLRLSLYLADNAIPVVCGDAGHSGSFQITECTYEAHIIKLEESAEMMIRQSTKMNYRIHGDTFRSFNTTLAQSDTQSSINIPVKCSSLKTLIVAHRYTADTTSKVRQSITNRTRGDLTEYYFTIGSKRCPQKPIKTTDVFCSDVFTNVQKALHHFGDRHTGVSFASTDFPLTATNAVGGAFVIMQDMESFSGKSDVLNTGESTVSQQIFFNGTYDSIPAQCLVTSFAHFDCMLEIDPTEIARVLF